MLLCVFKQYSIFTHLNAAVVKTDYWQLD